MTIEAHYNNHGDDKEPVKGDLLVTFSFPGEEIEDLCVGIDKRWMDIGDSDNYFEGWKDRILTRYESHAGRPLDVQLLDDSMAEANIQ